MIIGLGYKARAGKDTIADYLVENHGFKKIAFADALKRGCMEIFGLDYEQCYGDTKEVVDAFWNLTPRYILQKVGTECLRNVFDPEIWVKSVEKRVTDGGRWVIADARFINEAQAVKRWGGLVVRVDRQIAGATGGIAQHASEIEMDNYKEWDAVINNDGTFEDLYRRVDEVIKYVAL
jgi:dephospho-CoA kinase